MGPLRKRFLVSQLLAVVVIGLVLGWEMTGYVQTGWIVIATIFLFYFPGYWISLRFFTVGELSFFERVITGLAISFAFVLLLVAYLSVFSIELGTIHLFGLCRLVITCSFIGLMLAKQ